MERLAAALLLSCAIVPARAAAPHASEPEVLSGIDVLEADGFRELQGKRVGLITNQTGKDRKGRSTVDILAAAPGVELKALFAPEHGFAGTSEAAEISSSTLMLPGGKEIPIHSLYGENKAPTAEALRGLDALVFDIQDVGARFYTYAATMGMAMEAAASANLDFFVLDRPNPISGDIVEGPVLASGIRSFTAYFPIPVRHGLTVGEIARLHNVLSKTGARMQVIALKGWSREMFYDETGLPWTKPSPNMPDVEAAVMYPGIGCLESTNLSVGRGTPIPFRWIGAPWFDAKGVLERLNKANLAGVRFSQENYTPKKEPYAGKHCKGVRIQVVDRKAVRPLAVFAHILAATRDLHPLEFGVRWDEERTMIGNDTLKVLYEGGRDPREMIELFQQGPREFDAIRSAFLLY